MTIVASVPHRAPSCPGTLSTRPATCLTVTPPPKGGGHGARWQGRLEIMDVEGHIVPRGGGGHG